MTDFNHSNINQWLFDYFEGNLSPHDEQKIELFLLEHPEYEPDMNAWANTTVATTVVTYPHTEKLKRKRIGFFFWIQSTAAMLLLLLFVGAYFLLQPIKQQKVKSTVKSNLFLSTINNLALAQQIQNEAQHNALKSNNQNSTSFPIASIENTTTASEANKVNSSIHKTKQSALANFTPSASKTNRPFLSNSNGLKNNLRKTEKLTTATSKLLSENSSSEFSEIVLKMSDYPTEQKPIEITSSAQPTILLSDDGSLKGEAKEDVKKANRWLSKLSHKVKNMLNREVALRNLRDPMYIIPGLTQRNINFASTGGVLATRAQSFSRVQWAGTKDQSVDFRVAADGYVQALHGGIGLQIKYSNFNAGLLQNYEAAFTYSPKLKLGENFVLEPAVRFKMGTKSLNNNKINIGQQTEWDRGIVKTFAAKNISTNSNKLWYKDLGVGLMLNAKWFFVGVNLDNITRHRENLYGGNVNSIGRTPLNFTATLGTDYQSFNKKIALSSYIVYQNYGKRNEAWLGMTFRYHWLTLGGAISTNLDPAASVGLKFNRFMLTYSMDYAKNQVYNKRFLSGQLSLRFTMRQTKYGRKFNF